MTRQTIRDADRARARLARGIAAYAFGLDEADLDQPTRGRAEAALARQTAMYLAHTGFEMSLQRVAAAFDRDRSTVAHACHKIEDRRDDPRFDALLEQMEDALRAAPAQREAA
jgi:chromosomal replication initiation ATPase DnaA